MPTSRRPVSKLLAFSLVGTLFLLIGIASLVMSHAATSTIAVEPEQGTIAAPAVKIADSSATGANAIVFNPPTQQFLFGIGTELDGDLQQRLVAEAPVKLMTSWYNGPNDLAFMTGWKNSVVPQAYSAGKSLHLVVWSGDSEQNISTKYGPGCGRAYPLSANFTADMKQLATTFAGTGTLYVSMFTELQTYPCQDNTWLGSENYYQALKDQYLATMQIFRQYAPNAKLSLSWGGWQGSWDDPAKGGGKSLIPHFADVMNASDFQSFQAMDSNSNVAAITTMTQLLHAYGPVMLAHYKPEASRLDTWNADMDTIFAPANIASLQQNGLFAFSFMDDAHISGSEAAFQKAKTIVQTYAK